MIQLDTFADVLRAVGSHVDATGHHDIRLHDDPPNLLTGYVCHECDAPWAHWMAHADTIHSLPDAIRRDALDSSLRMRLVVKVIKRALEPKPYRPTAWEHVLRFSR